MTYTVKAFNPSTESENRIHADDVARAYGFRGGLVPGVTLWAYMVHPAVERHGPAFLSHGSMRAPPATTRSYGTATSWSPGPASPIGSNARVINSSTCRYCTRSTTGR